MAMLILEEYPTDAEIHAKTAITNMEKVVELILNSLKKQGYEILVIWLMDLHKDTENLTNRILNIAIILRSTSRLLQLMTCKDAINSDTNSEDKKVVPSR